MADAQQVGPGFAFDLPTLSVMYELVHGKTVAQAFAILDEFHAMMQSKGQIEPNEDVLEDAIAFAGVAKFPARVKCALLGWMAWKDATSAALSLKEQEQS